MHHFMISLLSVVVVLSSLPLSSSFIPTTQGRATTTTTITTTKQQQQQQYDHQSSFTSLDDRTTITPLFSTNSKEEASTTSLSAAVIGDDGSASSSTSSSPLLSFGIRRVKYGELGKVADLIVTSFYPEKSTLIRPYLYLSELQRLQSNFPYSDPHHHFFIAYDVTEPSAVVGFVDVDGRPSTLANAPPRPYLSDLAVQPNYRRQGIAKALIQQCEEVVSNDIMKKDELYLRVERDNGAAIHMYQSLGYHSLSHPFFGVQDTTILLHKELSSDTIQNNNHNQKKGITTTTTYDVLDYVV